MLAAAGDEWGGELAWELFAGDVEEAFDNLTMRVLAPFTGRPYLFECNEHVHSVPIARWSVASTRP